MLRYRLGALLFLFALNGLLYHFGEPFLLAAVVMVVCMVVALALLLRLDAKALHVELQARPGGQQGKDLPLNLVVRADRPLLAARCITVELEVSNAMWKTARKLRYTLPLTGRETTCPVPFAPQQCGRLVFTCTALRVQDLLNLTARKLDFFAPVQTVVYPQDKQVEVELSRATLGAAAGDGMMQNRKGGDPSEMFDIREYAPGDDVRTIHWKLSSKTDELIVRQASDPSHYNVAILPDFALQGATQAEQNAAVAYGAAIAAQLVRRGAGFCMALPSATGVELQEVHTMQEYERMLSHWLSSPVQEQPGDGLRYFLMDHLEQHFTRLVLLTAGDYPRPDLGPDGRIGGLMVSVGEGAAITHATLGNSWDSVTLPTELAENEVCRLLC